MTRERIVFMGSPDYAVPILKLLNEHYQVVGVITQPDQPVGRGKKIQSPPIKILSNALGIPVFQPQQLKGEDFIQKLKGMTPDAIVVAAYGKILPKPVLNLPEYGCINVHASLLPRWRGASPIQHAILCGDEKTGVTIMLMDEGVDTGPILSQSEISVDSQETAETLSSKLANEGAELLIHTIPQYFSGRITIRQQNEEGITYTSLLKKEDARMDFAKDADYLERQVRAFNPWPICFFEWKSNFLRVIKSEVSNSKLLESGQRGIADKYPSVGTSTVDLKLIEVQPAGKRVMSGKDFLNGVRDWAE
jgi:methionyl-tRNA formyltransferase